MYNKIYKRTQINVGNPYQVRNNLINSTIHKRVVEDEDDDENNAVEILEQAEKHLENAKIQVELVLKEAEIEFEKRLKEAEEEANLIKEDIFHKAKESGYKQGIDEARNFHEELINEAEQIKERAQIDHDFILRSMEAEIVNLAYEIAEKVIGEHITTNRNYIVGLITKTLEKCTNKENIIIKVSQDDYTVAKNNIDTIKSKFPEIGYINIVPFASINTGSVMIETQFGNVDGSVETKFRKIKESFEELLT